MSAFTNLRLGRRPVHSRVIVFHRIDPDAGARLLPDEVRPRLVEGHALAVLCYTRLGCLEGRFLPHRRSSTHHLDYRIAGEQEDGTPTTWAVRRETSSRLGARWNETVLRRGHGRSTFELEKDAYKLRLAVRSAQREELFLHVECTPATTVPGALLPTPAAVQDFLDHSGSVRPHDVLAPEADRIDARNAFTPEPLNVFELRSSFFDEHFRESARLDGAWRLASRRLHPVHARTTRKLREMLSNDGLPAV